MINLDDDNDSDDNDDHESNNAESDRLIESDDDVNNYKCRQLYSYLVMGM